MKNRLTQFLWSKINTIYYKGDKVICLLCEWKGLDFINGRCPNCFSLPRQRLIPTCINLFKPKNNSILHIAPNQGEFMYIKNTLKPNVYDRVDIVKTKYANIIHDITKVGMKENYYDLIIVWHVFEHIINDQAAIQNLSKCLNHHGSLLVSVPIFPKGNTTTYEDKNIPRSSYEKVHGHPDHYRSCGLDYWQRFLNNGLTSVLSLKTSDIEKGKRLSYGLSENHIAWLFKNK